MKKTKLCIICHVMLFPFPFPFSPSLFLHILYLVYFLKLHLPFVYLLPEIQRGITFPQAKGTRSSLPDALK